MVTSVTVVETSFTSTNSNPSQERPHLHSPTSRVDDTPGLQPFTVSGVLLNFEATLVFESCSVQVEFGGEKWACV